MFKIQEHATYYFLWYNRYGDLCHKISKLNKLLNNPLLMVDNKNIKYKIYKIYIYNDASALDIYGFFNIFCVIKYA